MGLGTTLTLVSMLTVGGISASVWVHNEHKEIDEKNVDIVVFEEQLAGLEGYLQESDLRGLKAERRGLKRELRQLDNTSDARELTPREKAYRRELTDQLEEVDNELER